MKKPLLLLWILTLAAACALPAAAQKKTVVRSDVLVVLVFAGENGQDQLGLTYPGVVSRTQAMRDVQAIKAATGLALRDVTVTTDTAPLKGETIKMTSVSMIAPNAISSQARAFTVEPLVQALRGYPHVVLSYFPPEGFVFEGLREWQDSHVRISLDQSRAGYTYQILIRDPNFRKLNLPLHQPPMSELRTVQQKESGGTQSKLIFSVALAALSVGAFVYLLAARRA